TPSMVAMGKSGERLVGILAKRQAVTNPGNTIFSVKRLIGRRWEDPEVQRDKEWLPYQIRRAENGGVEVHMSGKWYTPQEISAMVLQKLKMDAEEKLGEKITEAVITVPAYFDEAQRRATKEAGEIAGFTVRRILPEPTAAALAYGLDKKKEERILVYDFGGGTFDISILEVSPDTVEAKATGGDMHLGGDDFDQRLIQYIVEEFKKEQGIDLSKDALALQRVKEAAERAKHDLSTLLETEISLPFISSNTEGPKHLVMKLTRSGFEELVRDLVERSIVLLTQTLEEAKRSPSDIQEVILVGGQTRMPLMQEKVKTFFGKEPHKGINPDEVVAVGAAIQAGILQGDVKDVLLLDVTPLSLGIETLGGVFTRLIEKNTTIPASKTQIFSTAADNQTSVEVHVLQGEREMAGDNKTLGRFILDGIPPSPRGMPQVEVTFDVDVNGILTVSAKDKATSKSQSIRIEASTGLSKDEVERMKKEAELHVAEDKKRREVVEARNAADTLLYTAEKSLREAGEKVTVEVKKEVEEKIANLKNAKDGDDLAAIRRAQDELSGALSKVGEALYREQKSDGRAGPSTSSGSSEGPIEGKAEEVEKPEDGEPEKS
ncbi:molecular chaperone DnaK, partial [Candidatus Azambacteria bacterium]|nr:molecular chaperone DnaK [Candidatus Azambacteria bacterium]